MGNAGLRNAFLDRVRRERTAALSADEVNFAPDMEFWQGDERFITVLAVKLQMAKLPRRHREIVALPIVAGNPAFLDWIDEETA